MQNIIKDNIGVLLKSINYESVALKNSNKVDFEDEFKVVEVKTDIAEFQISRQLIVDVQVAYTLNVVAMIQVYAKENVDLKKQLTDEIIEKNKDDLSRTVMIFVSSLISQITGSFNGVPVITAPVLRIK